MKKNAEGYQEMDRRVFLQNAALAGIGVVATGAMAACSPTTPASESGGTSTGANTTDTALQPANDWSTVAAARWRQAPEPIAESDITDGGTFDVVVLGGGQAGTWTAAGAIENGASVAVIEVQSEAEFAYIGAELGVVNSQWAIARGAQQVDEVELLNEIFRRNAGRTNQTLTRDYIQHSGRIFDWAVEQFNDEEWLQANVHVHSKDRTDAVVYDASGYKYWASTVLFRGPEAESSLDWNYPVFLTFHRNRAIEKGVQWLWTHEAQYLEKNGERISSVIVKDTLSDTYKRFTATKGIVNAMGDFIQDVDMMRDINDEYRHLAEAYGDIELAGAGGFAGFHWGSGIKLGVWAGGHVEVGPRAGMLTNMGSHDTLWGPGGLVLNQLGKRFCDEVACGPEGVGYQVPRQPRGAITYFADANWGTIVEKMPPCHNSIDQTFGMNYSGTFGARQAIMAAIQPGDTDAGGFGVRCANTIEELLDMIDEYSDEQKQTALASIRRYNELAEAGYDADFGTDSRILQPLDTAPFYAIVGDNLTLFAGICQTTGLDCNGEYQMLNDENLPIEGLYVVGNSCGNRFINHYSTPIAGMSIAYCLAEGFLVGERLARL
jgi:hypothetical protein